MAFATDSLMVDGLILGVTLLGLLYYYLKSPFDYWHKRGVPYVKPVLLFGNLKDQLFMKKSLIECHKEIYDQLEGTKFGGYFESRKPVLMIRDGDLIERILVKDFSYFHDRDFPADPKREPLTGNLFGLKGALWKNIRNKLIPTFTTGKLRGMLEQICNCGDGILEEIEEMSSKNEPVDAKILGSTFTIDVIASCAFGLQFKKDSPEGIKFRKMVDSFFGPSILKMLRLILVLFFKSFARFLGLRQVPKEVDDYVINIVKSTMEFREKNNIQRNDFLQMMMNLKAQEASGKEMNWKVELSGEDAYLDQMNNDTKDDQMDGNNKVFTDECIAAQAFVFLAGGTESVANAISFTLFELATNPDVQKHVQQEVDQVLGKYGGKLTYEGLKEMTYLDLVVQEKNRKYSLGGFLQRVCNAPYKIPGTDVLLEKGTRIVIPLYALHNDPANYPEPDKFIPERFENNNHRTSAKYLPFGDGPRMCIAMRFVILELKAAIAKIMSKYSVSLNSRTKVPLRYDPTSIILLPIGGVWVDFQKRS